MNGSYLMLTSTQFSIFSRNFGLESSHRWQMVSILEIPKYQNRQLVCVELKCSNVVPLQGVDHISNCEIEYLFLIS